MSPAECSELERMIHDPDRFHSDGVEVMWTCIVIPLICIPLMAVLFPYASSAATQIRSGELALGSQLLFEAPELLGVCGLLVIAIGFATYGIRTFRRHGVVVTSFGIARVRGKVWILIRYPEIESVTFEKRRRPRYRVVTNEVEVKAKDGRTIMLYGFGVLRQKQLIEQNTQQASKRIPGADQKCE